MLLKALLSCFCSLFGTSRPFGLCFLSAFWVLFVRLLWAFERDFLLLGAFWAYYFGQPKGIAIRLPRKQNLDVGQLPAQAKRKVNTRNLSSDAFDVALTKPSCERELPASNAWLSGFGFVGQNPNLLPRQTANLKHGRLKTVSNDVSSDPFVSTKYIRYIQTNWVFFVLEGEDVMLSWRVSFHKPRRDHVSPRAAHVSSLYIALNQHIDPCWMISGNTTHAIKL